MKIGSYITLEPDEKLKQFRVANNSLTYSYTMGGVIFFSFNAAIPVIIKKGGCVGLARIIGLKITESSTRIDFTIVAHDEDYTAIYNQYLLTASNDVDDSDPYSANDQLIPGMGTAGIGKRINSSRAASEDTDLDEDDYARVFRRQR